MEKQEFNVPGVPQEEVNRAREEGHETNENEKVRKTGVEGKKLHNLINLGNTTKEKNTEEIKKKRTSLLEKFK